MSIKISIIIPVYNAEKFLRQCLDSVAQQSYKNIEIICIDDGSVDTSSEILKNFADKDSRFVYIRQEHSNAAKARNHGLLHCSGEYVTFLDADDFLERDIIEKYVETTKTNADIIVSQYKLFDNAKNIGLKTVYGIHTNKRKCFCIMGIKDKKFNITNIAVWNKLYKLSFIRNNNICFKSHDSLNDMYFGLVSLALAQSIYMCRNVSINYRINVMNSISTKILHTKEIFIDVLSEINERLCKEKNWSKFKSDLLLAEKSQLMEFYNRLKKNPLTRADAQQFRKNMDSFLQYYSEL